MRGLVKYARGPGNVAVREVPEPALSDGEVLVEIEATGICGSDLHILEDRIEIPIRVPVVMGHEFSGRIVDRGKDVSGLGVAGISMSRRGPRPSDAAPGAVRLHPLAPATGARPQEPARSRVR